MLIMGYTKYINTLSFTYLFLSGDNNIFNQSPDYYLEKSMLFLGENIIFKENKNKKFINYSNTWNYRGDEVHIIFNYFNMIINTAKTYNNKIINIPPQILIKIFKNHYDNIKYIPSTLIVGLHPTIKKEMIDKHTSIHKFEIKQLKRIEILEKLLKK